MVAELLGAVMPAAAGVGQKGADGIFEGYRLSS